MRKVVFGTGPQVDDDVLSPAEIGSAPLALVVEHMPPEGNVYRIKVRIVVRDAEVLAQMRRHHLFNVELYIDRAAETLDKEKAEILKTMKEDSFKHGGVYPWSPDFFMSVWRGVRAVLADQTVVRMNLRSLLSGMEIKGKFDEVRWLVKQLSGAVDRLGAELAAGEDFDGGAIKIFVPGAKPAKPKKPGGTPPSKW